MREEKSKRRIRHMPYPDPEKAKMGEKVKALSLDFRVVEEHWNIYELEDGTRVRVRASVTRCDKPLDMQTEEWIRKEDGAPVYGIEFGVEAVFDFSEEALKK